MANHRRPENEARFKQATTKEKIPSNYSEAESNIARALEAEDKLRFGTGPKISNAIEPSSLAMKGGAMLKIENKEKPKKEHRHSHKSHKSRNLEKFQKKERSCKTENHRKKITRRCHSDSEIDSVFRDAKNRIAKRAFIIDRKPSTRPECSEKVKKHNDILKKDALICKAASNGSAENIVSYKSIVKNSKENHVRDLKTKEQCRHKENNERDFENASIIEENIRSYPFTNAPCETSKNCAVEDCNHNKMLNLLLEYFKELTKEICEFREEKKNMRGQIWKLETNQEKLANAVEAQKLKIRSLADQISKKEINDAVKLTRPDLNVEVQSVLEDVNKKYQEQLVQHEVRMKCVQEQAEHDIRNLMRNIVDNYVELSQLKGKEKYVESLIGKHMTAIRSREPCLQLGPTMPFCCKEDPEKTTSKVSNESDTSKKPTQKWEINLTGMDKPAYQKSTKKYEFYFPRNESKLSNVDEHHTKENKSDSRSSEDRGMKDNRNSSVESIPKGAIPGNASAYLEWRQFLRDKLTQRTSIECNGDAKKNKEDQRNIN